jgi:1,4-alpha-glucan branching enzyme
MAVRGTDRKEVFAIPDLDLHLFHEGTHYRLYEKLGAHLLQHDKGNAARFAVWAPNADAVSVIGEFNQWNDKAHHLSRGPSGVWSGVIPNVRESAAYKYYIHSKYRNQPSAKADPFGFFQEPPLRTASLVWDLSYEWHDAEWMRQRGERGKVDRPISIYEVHLGSWMRVPEDQNRYLTYREIAPKLAAHVETLGFTHVELLPVMEHPFYGSWGYQGTGYFAPTSRYGAPQDLMYLIDYLHGRGIGVFLDWVPSHFASDEHGLASFDGTALYEYEDPREGLHPVWQSSIFNYARKEVRSFLISSAFFWLEKYHADGLRVDGVASMLYRDYLRAPGEWTPNQFGGRENLEAIDFLRQLNTEVYRVFPDVQMIAEESTAWPLVSRPVHVGGLGFGYKWDMGFAHDMLQHLQREPSARKAHYNELTFRGLYAFNENFILPFSHDDVNPRRGSLISRMPGDEWRKFANLRLLFAYMFLQPGKKLLFMGNEFGQWQPWNHDASLDWHLTQMPNHAGVQRLVSHLNQLYVHEPALQYGDANPTGFEWVDCHDAKHGAISWLRWDQKYHDVLVCVFNLTPHVYRNFKLGAPRGGLWREVVNTDAAEYGGSAQGNFGGVQANPFGYQNRSYSLTITLPPLAGLAFKQEPQPHAPLI